MVNFSAALISLCLAHMSASELRNVQLQSQYGCNYNRHYDTIKLNMVSTAVYFWQHVQACQREDGMMGGSGQLLPTASSNSAAVDN